MSAINTYRPSSPHSPSLFSDSTEPNRRISILSRQVPLSTEPSDSLTTDWTFSKILPPEATLIQSQLTNLKFSAFKDVASLDEEEKCNNEEEEKYDPPMGDQKDRYFALQLSEDHPVLKDSIYCQEASCIGSKTSAGSNHRTVLFPKKLFDTRLIEQLFTKGEACLFYENPRELTKIIDFIGSRSLIAFCNRLISNNLENDRRKGKHHFSTWPNKILPHMLSILADHPSPTHLMLIAATNRSSNLALDLDSINLNTTSGEGIEWIARHAAKNNNKDVMQVLIKTKRWERSEALVEAVKYDSYDVIKVFLTDDEAHSYCCSQAIEEAARKLGASISWVRTFPTSSKKDRVLVGTRKLLLGNKLDTIKLLWPKASYRGRNLAIVVAAHQGSLQLVKDLLANRIIPDEFSYSSYRDNFIDCCSNALYYAAQYGFLEIARELLANGITSSSSRSRALVEAARYGSPEIVRVLLAHESVSRDSITAALDDAKQYSQNKEVIKILNRQLDCCVIS